MEKEFIPYEQALTLKELGFNEPCFGYYKHEELLIEGKYKNSDHGFSISVPTFSQAFRWFRENYNLHCFIQCPEEPIGKEIHTYTKWCFSVFEINKQELFFSNEKYNTYEEAELECLKKLIEIVKKQQEYESNIIV